MRFSTNVLLSLVALAPGLVLAAPAPQDTVAIVGDSALVASARSTAGATSNNLAVTSAPAQTGSSGSSRPSGSCSRGGRGGRGRWGQARPLVPPAGSGSSNDEAAANTDPVDAVPSDAGLSEVESTTTIEEVIEETVTLSEPAAPVEPVETQPVNLVATGQEAGGGGAGGPTQPPQPTEGNGSGEGQPQGQDQGEGQAPAPSGGAEPAGSSSPPPAGDGGSDSGSGAASGFEADMLAATNEYRKQFNAEPLVWNATMAALERDHYTQKNCVMEHSKMNLGENLQSGGGLSAAGAVQGWGPNEEPNWNKGDGFKEGTGHFTQLVWKATKTVGCAHVKCASQEIIACGYWPGGNVEGAYGENVGK